MKEISAEKFYLCQKYNGDIPIRKPISLCIPELFIEEAKYQLVEQFKKYSVDHPECKESLYQSFLEKKHTPPIL